MRFCPAPLQTEFRKKKSQTPDWRRGFGFSPKTPTREQGVLFRGQKDWNIDGSNSGSWTAPEKRPRKKSTKETVTRHNSIKSEVKNFMFMENKK